MAIEKETITPFGINGNYIKIHSLKADMIEQKIVVTAYLYLSADARNNNCQPISHYVVELPMVQNFDSNIMSHCYACLKSMDAFAGASDV